MFPSYCRMHNALKVARHEAVGLSARHPGAGLCGQVGLPWRAGSGDDRATARRNQTIQMLCILVAGPAS